MSAEVRRPAARLLHGCLRAERGEDGWVRPWRVTEAQLRALSSSDAWHPGLYRQMAACTAGVTVELETTADRLVLELRRDPVPQGSQAVLSLVDGWPDDALDGVSADVDGRHLPCRMPALGEEAVEFDLRGDQATLPGLVRRRVRVWLPCLVGCRVRDVVCDGPVEPVPARRRALFLGDSVTQGFVAGDPARTLPALVADRMGCEAVNQGIGGQVIQPASLADLGDAVPDPRLVVVELGANYRYEPCSPAEVARDAGRYLELVSRTWPEAPTLVVTPLPHDEGAWPTHPRSCFPEVPRILARAARGRDTMHLVDGSRLLEASPATLADDAHPTAAGFAQAAEALLEVVWHRRRRAGRHAARGSDG